MKATKHVGATSADAVAQISVDREAVKTLALTIGVREAARQLGLNEDRVRKWSQRYNWFPKQEPQPASQLTKVQSQKAFVTTVSPSQVLAKYGEETKANLAKAAHKASTTFQEQPGLPG